MSGHLHYFVEGECEKAFIKAFMFCDGDSFCDGQVEVFNFVNEKLSTTKARTIQRDSRVAIVIDTDVENVDLLEKNIETLAKVSMIKREDIYLILSIRNFEEEIVFSCADIRNIHQLFLSNGLTEFKKKFLTHDNLYKKFKSVGFNMKKIWSRSASNAFSKYNNDGRKIKTKNNK